MARRHSTVTLPTEAGMVLLQAPFPLQPDEWDAMLGVLDAMKIGLAEPRPDEETEPCVERAALGPKESDG